MLSEFNGVFDKEFCSVLEYHLSKSFRSFDDNVVSNFWCDGIAMPFVESQLENESIRTRKTVETKAWIGKDGQDEYLMTIRFGRKSVENYLTSARLEECLPDVEAPDWINIDPSKKTIELLLI